MAYEIRLFNPLFQHGKKNFTLTFHDPTGEVADFRWDKKYPEGVTKARIIADLKQTIKAFAVANEITWDDAKTNGATLTVDLPGGSKYNWSM